MFYKPTIELLCTTIENRNRKLSRPCHAILWTEGCGKGGYEIGIYQSHTASYRPMAIYY